MFGSTLEVLSDGLSTPSPSAHLPFRDRSVPRTISKRSSKGRGMRISRPHTPPIYIYRLEYGSRKVEYGRRNNDRSKRTTGQPNGEIIPPNPYPTARNDRALLTLLLRIAITQKHKKSGKHRSLAPAKDTSYRLFEDQRKDGRAA